MRLKIFKKLSAARFNSKFSGSYKKCKTIIFKMMRHIKLKFFKIFVEVAFRFFKFYKKVRVNSFKFEAENETMFPFKLIINGLVAKRNKIQTSILHSI